MLDKSPAKPESPTNRVRRIMVTGAVVGWMAFIFYLSSLSQDQASDIAGWFGDIKGNVAHFLLYGVLAALIQASMWSWNFGYQLRWLVVAALIASLYGVSDEVHQTFVAGRSATFSDVMVNTIGATSSAVGLWCSVKLLPIRLER